MKYQTTFVITEDDVVHEADWKKVKCLIHPTEVKLTRIRSTKIGVVSCAAPR